MESSSHPIASTSTPRVSITANLPTATQFLSFAPPTASPTAAPTNQHLFESQSRKRRQKRQREPDVREGNAPARADERAWGALQPRRTDGLPFATGYPDCNYVGNNILSCFPLANTTLVEDVWSKFIWNAQLPTFIGAGYLDVYLYHADSESVAKKYSSVANAQGMIAVLPDEDWWRTETQHDWDGAANLTWPYFFVVVTANATLNGAEMHQSTFAAIQTSMPASLSSSSSSSTSASSRSASASNGSTSLQPNSSGDSTLAAWAIALLVIFGLAFLILLLLGAYFLMRYMRKRSLAAYTQGLESSATSQEMREAPPRTETPAGLTPSDAERMAQAFRDALRDDGARGSIGQAA